MFNAAVGTAFVTGTTIALFVLVGPIVRTALRTGRWLGQGVVYDRVATPVRFRLALGSVLSLMLLFVWLSVFLSYQLALMLTR